jgi:hypothetical protein
VCEGKTCDILVPIGEGQNLKQKGICAEGHCRKCGTTNECISGYGEAYSCAASGYCALTPPPRQ